MVTRRPFCFQSHSPRSSPNTSPRAHEPALAHTPHSAPPSTYNSYNPYPQRAASAPPTPGDTLSSLSGDVSQAFGHPSSSSMITGAPSAASSVRSLRQDLLVAADSVTNAMSSLVKELNSEASSSEDESMRSTGGFASCGECCTGENLLLAYLYELLQIRNSRLPFN